MMNRITALLTAITMALSAGAVPAHSSDSTRQSVGLVLSGGGAKGIAHIGVIQALEDNDIPIDYITGTSMGAIIGGLYACGYTPEEMLRLIESREFSYWSTGQVDKRLTYYFWENEPTPALMTLNLGDGSKSSSGNGSVLPASIINPIPMNFGVMELFSAYTAQCGGNFDRLFVPYRCITSNVTAKHKMVCSSGQLGEAIRASMNFPIVFHPIKKDGQLLYDGGIYENYPVATMRRDFAPSIMIGVDVSVDEKSNSNDIIDQLEDLIIQHSSHAMPPEDGIGLRIDLNEFGLLDFGAARTIYKIGYDHAMAMMDSIKGRVTARIPSETRTLKRMVFKSRTPALRFDSVHVSGATPAQNRYIASMFRPRHHEDTMGILTVRDAYYRAVTPGMMKNFTPVAWYNDTTGLFTLDLTADVKNKYDVALGGYISSSTSSMLYFSGSYRTFSYRSVSARLKAWIGQSYMAGEVAARLSIESRVPLALELQAVGSRQKFFETEKLFFSDDEPAFVQTDEMFARLGLSTAIGRRGKASAGVGYGHITDKYYTDLDTEMGTRHRDRSTQNMGQVFAKLSASSLNDLQYPTGGAKYSLEAYGVTGTHTLLNARTGDKSRTHRTFVQAEFKSANYWSAGRHIAIGLESDILVSSRSLLSGYYASIVDAPAYHPTVASYTVFDPALRAYNFIAAGLVPVWKLSDMVQVRATASGFMPLHRIERTPQGAARYGKWLNTPIFTGELAAVVTLPFASVSAYGRYTDTQAGRWNFGISLGFYIPAPRFLR
ncbi:MAG: patatin-like phospholipase family protein [Muribaculaceae bacterium]|nr:patatin-like phospholipase family protein [Muribaculaceae bacterium]